MVFLTTGFFAGAAFALVAVVVFFGAGAFALAVVLGFAVVVPAFAALGLAAAALGLAEALEAGLFCVIFFRQAVESSWGAQYLFRRSVSSLRLGSKLNATRES
jgi:energy-coupling factor transporter transmembrane protein EcfT